MKNLRGTRHEMFYLRCLLEIRLEMITQVRHEMCYLRCLLEIRLDMIGQVRHEILVSGECLRCLLSARLKAKLKVLAWDNV